ncbi:hypothetical protein BDW42DRAFT_157766 [Aspergillus taichungensis]|uniref:Uncharacterized protein n=1 Tax=Aspergillus taichungensis TaxID=482145 RepID=A0A2J5I9R0_9EURO|nr:hypothetical protein BDW42DRAFT_157766 [Aspergillus taichungensis]
MMMCFCCMSIEAALPPLAILTRSNVHDIWCFLVDFFLWCSPGPPQGRDSLSSSIFSGLLRTCALSVKRLGICPQAPRRGIQNIRERSSPTLFGGHMMTRPYLIEPCSAKGI